MSFSKQMKFLSKKIARPVLHALGTAKSQLTDGPRLLRVLRQLNERPFIVVFSNNFPYPELLSDGYFQRVKRIDDQLAVSLVRVYVDFTTKHRSVETRTEDVVIYKATKTGFRNWYVDALCRRAAAVYWHGIGRFGNPVERFAADTPGPVKIWDVHGAGPEECRMMGGGEACRVIDGWEATLAAKAHTIICVSESMREHLQRKYDLSGRKFVIVPIFEPAGANPKLSRSGPPRFVYAGGAQVWQCIPEMMEAIGASLLPGPVHLLTPNVDVMRAAAPAADIASGRIVIESVPHADMARRYEQFSYGFLVRKDSVVNRIACPTKLIEYMEYGVVPILAFDEIGDFMAKGMRYVPLADFVAGRLPTEAQRDAMALANADVLRTLRTLGEQGLKDLRAAISASAGLDQVPPRLDKAALSEG